MGYKLKDLPWKPNIVIGQVFASGDSNPADGTVKSFRTTFGGTDGSLYGRMDIMKWNNLVENLVEVNLKPASNMKLKLSYHDFSKDKAEDV
ncbi:MAG: alginate export family protein [Campylobacterales bacterium]|nr:alginate export family protein [Campylobacterales bacterium]